MEGIGKKGKSESWAYVYKFTRKQSLSWKSHRSTLKLTSLFLVISSHRLALFSVFNFAARVTNSSQSILKKNEYFGAKFSRSEMPPNIT